jgi:DNA-directed RNA polymerase specialized sigma24 family protein
MSSPVSSNEAPKAFPLTRWSVVLAATQQGSPESSEALEAICRAYWHPLYAYARRCGHSPEDAQDTTQEFFRRLLEKRWLDNADREKGRLRTFLIVALKHFMANESRRLFAQKRGGGESHVPLDTVLSETGAAADTNLSAEEVYDRQWALTLLDLTLKKLQAEFAAAGRAADFDGLKCSLTAAHGAIDYAAIGRQLDLNAGAARVAVHRLRKRFRELYREEISQTLAEGADLDGELRHLAAALAREG